MWKTLYTRKYNQPFHIKWFPDGSAFKRLMSTYSNIEIKQLIEFAFKDSGKTTKFLRDTGYSISVFEREINKYRQYVGGGCVEESELDLDLSYWDDYRFSFLCTCINNNDLVSLLQVPYDDESDNSWRLLIEKVKRQDKSFLCKVKIYYRRWKVLTSTKRRRMTNG